jgi:hypothetical protein
MEGEAAPFDGDLWPVTRSLRMALRAEACAERAAADLAHAVRGFEIELKFDRKEAEVERRGDQDRILILKNALANAHPWYREPVFVAFVSVAATLTAILVAVAVIEAALVPFAQMANP